MVSFAFTVFGVDWEFLKPYIVLGLALGSVYALSGVGVVVLYQATGVLNLAFGAIGAAGALIAYYLVNHTSMPALARATSRASSFGGAVNLLYGMVLGPAFARARSARQDDGDARAGADPARRHGLARAGGRCVRPRAPAADVDPPLRALRRGRHLDAGHRARLRRRCSRSGTTLFLRITNLGTAMRALASDREITATLGVPVRRVEISAWLGSGIVCGTAGLHARRPVHVARLHGAHVPRDLVARRGAHRSAAVALGRRSPAASRSGSCRPSLTPYASITAYRTAAPFVLAIIALLWLGRHRIVTISRTAG